MNIGKHFSPSGPQYAPKINVKYEKYLRICYYMNNKVGRFYTVCSERHSRGFTSLHEDT